MKKFKISNNNLVVLLGVAIFISIIGTWATLSLIDQITGAATSTGTASLTITSVTSCTTSGDNSIAFGTLARGTSNNSDNKSDWISLENDGNVDINVSAYASAELWADSSYVAPTAYWQIECNSSQGASCQTGYVNLAASASRTSLETNLTPNDDADLMYVGVNVTVPSDETAGAKSGTMTFECIAI